MPYAEVSNIKRTSNNNWECDVTLKGGAQSYYWAAWSGQDMFFEDGHFVAWHVYNNATTGKINADKSNHKYLSTQIPDPYFTIATWGISSSGTIGDYKCYSSYSNSFAPVQQYKPARENRETRRISKKKLEEMCKTMRIMKIEGK